MSDKILTIPQRAQINLAVQNQIGRGVSTSPSGELHLYGQWSVCELRQVADVLEQELARRGFGQPEPTAETEPQLDAVIELATADAALPPGAKGIQVNSYALWFRVVRGGKPGEWQRSRTRYLGRALDAVEQALSESVPAPKPEPAPATEEQIAAIYAIAKAKGLDGFKGSNAKFGLGPGHLTRAQAAELIRCLRQVRYQR